MQLKLLSTRSLSKVIRYCLILLSAIFIFLTTVLIKQYFALDSFEIEGISSVNIRGFDKLRGKNLLLLQEKEVMDYLHDLNPEIEIIKVLKSYPKKIKIIVRVLEPLVFFKVNNGYLALEENGRVVYKKHEIDKVLPIIRYYQQFNYSFFNPGNKLDYLDIITALYFAKASLQLGLNIDTIDINSANMLALNTKDKKIFLSTGKDHSKQQYELVTIIQRFRIEGKEFKVLDLRFDKPVIRF